MKFSVFSSDPLYKYHDKGEIKPRYWNPEDLFEEVYVFSFCDRDIEPDKVQALVGSARLEIIPIGYPCPQRLWHQRRQALNRLRDIAPDLVRVHNPWHAGVVGLSAANQLSIPSILSLHTHYGARRNWERRWLLRALWLFERYSVPRADVVLCVSNYLEDYARQMGAREIEVIYNRVYTDQFQFHPSVNNRPVILSVGRLDPPKDQACLIRALVGLEVDLHLVGEGANKRQLEALARDLGLSEQVRFIGSVPHAQIQHYYAEADFFALATYYEGFGMPVLEAMAAGLPTAVSCTDPLPEILGERGWVVEHEPKAFHQVFERWLAEPDRARAMGEQARERALSLDGAIMESKEAALYRRLIEK